MTDRDAHFIVTATGRRFWPLDPRPEDVDLDDIAHHLGHLCRWTGSTREFYSVAEHSVCVGDLVEERGGTAVEVAWGYLHDAGEAYLCDIARPVKHHPAMAFYRDAEDRLLRVIGERFGLPWPLPAIVKQADDDILAAEALALMPRDPALESLYSARDLADALRVRGWVRVHPLQRGNALRLEVLRSLDRVEVERACGGLRA